MNPPRPFSGSQAMRPLQGWLPLVVLAILLAVFLYTAWQKQATHSPTPGSSAPDQQQIVPGPSVPVANDDRQSPEAMPSPTGRVTPKKAPSRNHIANQTIRNEDGKVVYRGEVDLGPTLDRIQRGERLSFSHDGTTFQNRERRLPPQSGGYYKEYVHPTPGVGGPGPQRIVTGKQGEIYYTPDHYRTFQRLDKP